MNIELIWAQDQRRGIGKKGKLPWNISEDLQNFKKITLGFPIIMGRKTWQSLPFKPLPKRRNIVLSSKLIQNVECYQSVDDCIKNLYSDSIEKIFIIGGRSIYKIFYKKASALHITLVNKNDDDVDTFFPISMKKIEKDFVVIKKKNLSEIATYKKYTQK